MTADASSAKHQRILHGLVAVGLILVVGKFLGLWLRPHTQEVPAPEPPPVPLAFAADGEAPVLRLSLVGPDGPSTPIFTLAADGTADGHPPVWSAEQDAPTPAERERGYCLRAGRILFAPDARAALSPAEQTGLLAAVARAGLEELTADEFAARLERRGRVRARRRRAVPDAWRTEIALRTNRGAVTFAPADLDGMAEQYDVAERAWIDRLLAFRELIFARARDLYARRVAPEDQRRLLEWLRTGSAEVARAAGESLWNYGGPAVVPEILEALRTSPEARTVRDLGAVLSGLSRRGVGVDAMRPAMLACLQRQAVASSAERARLCLAMQWWGVFGGPEGTQSLLAFFEDKDEVRWRLIAPAPFVDARLRYAESAGAQAYALVPPNVLAGAVLVRLARRGAAAPELREALLALLQEQGFRTDGRRADAALKILAWCGDAGSVAALVRDADRILPLDIETPLDYGVLLPAVDAPEIDRMLAARLASAPPLTAWQVCNLLGCAIFPDTPCMRSLWRRLLDYEGAPQAGVPRVRALAARELWRVQDAESLDRLVPRLAEAIAAGLVNPHNAGDLRWDWPGTDVLVRALAAQPAPAQPVQQFRDWIQRQRVKPAVGPVQTGGDDDDVEIF